MKLLKPRTAIIFWLLTTVVAVATGSYYVLDQRQLRYPYTQDAKLEAVAVPVMALANGRVGALHTNNNMLVTQGQLLVELENTASQAAVQRAQENLLQVQQQVSTALAAVNAAEDAVYKQQEVLSDISKQLFQLQQYGSEDAAIAKEDLQTAGNDLEMAYGDLTQAYQGYGRRGEAKARIQAAQTVLAKAELKLSDTRIIAPVSGYVTDFNIKAGSPVLSNQKLFNIIENNNWWVAAYFNSRMLTKIKPKQLATITLSNSTEPVYGMVDTVDTSTHPATVVIKILDPESDLLRIGADAAVKIDTNKLVQDNYPKISKN